MRFDGNAISSVEREKFGNNEALEIAKRNASLSERHRQNKGEIERRREQRQTIVVTCMDERNTEVEESLGLLPGEAEVYASGGGKMTLETFEANFGDTLAKAGDQKEVVVYLTPHECGEKKELGCAAFGNDTDAQKALFTDLQAKIQAKYPSVRVHVLAVDTSTSHLRPIETDLMDAEVGGTLKQNAARPDWGRDVQHAGYGIYVGEAYRAWVDERNTYFRLSAQNPDLAGNTGIALSVMEHHSDVDLSDKQIILHVDYPRYGDGKKTSAAKESIDQALSRLATAEGFGEKVRASQIKVIKTETDMETWTGGPLAA